MMSNVVEFKIKVVFIIGVFFFVSFYNIEITTNSSCFSSNIKYIYILILKFSDSFISESFFSSIFNIYRDIDIKTFPKSIENDIRFIFTMLIFF